MDTAVDFHLVVVGAGPAGLSAAARASQIDARDKRASASYVLLEGSPRVAKTIQRYQKGKHVMAEPGFLDLRSDMKFAAGSREQILDGWGSDAQRLGINVRYNADVRKIRGQKGDFQLQLADGSTLRAANIVLAIGVEGNPRKLGVPGDHFERSSTSWMIPRNIATRPSWWSAPEMPRSRTPWRSPSRTTFGSSIAATNSAAPRTRTCHGAGGDQRPAPAPAVLLQTKSRDGGARAEPHAADRDAGHPRR